MEDTVTERIVKLNVGRFWQYHIAITHNEKNTSNCTHHKKKLCRKTVCFRYTLIENKLKTLKAHFKDNGVTRAHENTRRLKTTTCTIEFEAVKLFIGNYTTVNVINLPGRALGYISDIVSLLPTGHNKHYVYQHYCLTCEAVIQSKVSYWVFQRFWSDFFPDLFAAQPRTDLYFECQKTVLQF